MALLTNEQKCALRTDMDTHPELAAAVSARDLGAIVAFYNAPTQDLCWRTTVTLEEVQQAMDWAAYCLLAVPSQNAFTMMLQLGFLATGQSNVRAGLAQIFADTAQLDTRDALIAASKRAMTVAEALFADDAQSPATLVIEGPITSSDVLWALDNCA